MASHIGRRKFLATLGAAAAWPLAVRAQQAGKLPTVGFAGSNASAWGPWTAAFAARMHELSWIEGRTLAIEYRWSEGRPERIDEIAAEFVNRNVDVIVTNDSSAPTMKQATSVIPIVFVLGNDPLGTGLVTNQDWGGQQKMCGRYSTRVDFIEATNTIVRSAQQFRVLVYSSVQSLNFWPEVQ